MAGRFVETQIRPGQGSLPAMRTTAGLLFPAFVLTLLVSVPGQCSGPGTAQEASAKAVNAFAIDLYRQIEKPEGNFFFSPYSISTALGMAYAGACGRTASQMAKALHFDLDQEKTIKAFRDLNAQVLATGRGKSIELNIANALWAEKSHSFRKEYLESIRTNFAPAKGWSSRVPVVKQMLELVGTNYQEGVRQFDFRHAPEAARNTINNWVEDQTKHKIKDLLPPGSVTTDTRLVLSNAIYFKGLWESPFKKEVTKEAPFTPLGGKEVMVQMMHTLRPYGFAEETGLQLLEIPYKGGELAMIVLLPNKGKHLEEFERSITLDKLGQWTGSLKTQKVEVFFPRFTMTSTFQLSAPLVKMGMKDAFSSADADFSGMTGRKDIFISEGFHEAFVEVNEEGTEAAAATAVAMRTGSRPLTPVFRADRPFLFLIQHKPSRCILFFGRATNPVK